MNNTVYIYTLSDPRIITNNIFYVGRTHNTKTRLSQHINEAKKILEHLDPNHIEIFGWDYVLKSKAPLRKHPKIRKIIEILNSGNLPVMNIIDEWEAPSSLKDENRLEDAWIAEMQNRGYKLTNHIYSHRQSYDWYKSRNKQLELKTESPMEYIIALKSKAIVHDDNSGVYNWRLNRSNARRKYAKRNARKAKKK